MRVQIPNTFLGISVNPRFWILFFEPGFQCSLSFKCLFLRLKKNERDLLKVLDVLLEATERRKSLRRGRQFEDDPELAGFVLDQKRTTRQSSALDDNLQGFERQVDTLIDNGIDA